MLMIEMTINRWKVVRTAMNDTRVMDVFHSFEYGSHKVRSVTRESEKSLRTGIHNRQTDAS